MKILNVVLSSLLHPHGITTWFRNYLKGLIDNRNENKIVFLTLTSISQKLDWYTEKHENFTQILRNSGKKYKFAREKMMLRDHILEDLEKC